MRKPRIALLSLGGTVSMAEKASDGLVPSLSGEMLVASTPGISETADIETASLLKVPGAHLTLDDVLSVGREIQSRVQRGAAGIVITQGTDTIEETAFVLDSLLDREEPVVVTGAMRNPGLPGADGPANLLAAVQTAAAPGARGLGTLVVMNDEIHAARFVRKAHTSNPAAFVSPLVGPLGWVSEGRPTIALRPTRLACVPFPADNRDHAVALLRVGLGDDGRMLRVISQLGFEGLVIEGLGGGHVPKAMVDDLVALARDLPVVLASRAGAGEILQNTYGFVGSETYVLKRGLLSAGYLDGLKARLLLTLLLRAGATSKDIRAAFRERAPLSVT